MQKTSRILSFILLALNLVFVWLAFPEVTINPDFVGIISALGYLLVLAAVFSWGFFRPSALSIIVTVLGLCWTIGAIILYIGLGGYTS